VGDAAAARRTAERLYTRVARRLLGARVSRLRLALPYERARTWELDGPHAGRDDRRNPLATAAENSQGENDEAVDHSYRGGRTRSLGVCACCRSEVLPPSAEPMQMSYELWAVQWTKMALQRDPRSPTALLAFSNGKCGVAFGKAWLLPASVTGQLVSRCRIPAGKVIVVVVGTNGAVGGHPRDLRSAVRSAMKATRDVRLAVDGRDLGPGYVTWTPLFIVKLPRHNIFGPPSATNPSGLANVVAANFQAILSPLRPGSHTITTTATYPTPDGPSTQGITFHLTVG
jgi:hypothetical protein